MHRAPGSVTSRTSGDADFGDVCRIASRDLISVARAAILRLESLPQEGRREARIRDLIRAANLLQRARELHPRHTVVSCSGTRGNADLEADGRALFDALSQYAATVQQVGSEYASVPVSGPNAFSSLRAPQGAPDHHGAGVPV